MKVAVLFSGGKDSTYACKLARESEEVVCLVTVVSKNPESYMYHTPNISLVELQAKAMGLPLVKVESEGEKELELLDLKLALERAKMLHAIQGVVTGAVESVYQAERIERICFELDLWCFSPLWKSDQLALLNEMLGSGMRMMISGVYAYPLRDTLAGEIITSEVLAELVAARDSHGVSVTGEGGEIETSVLDAPFFTSKVIIVSGRVQASGSAATYIVEDARLEPK